MVYSSKACGPGCRQRQVLCFWGFWVRIYGIMLPPGFPLVSHALPAAAPLSVTSLERGNAALVPNGLCSMGAPHEQDICDLDGYFLGFCNCGALSDLCLQNHSVFRGTMNHATRNCEATVGSWATLQVLDSRQPSREAWPPAEQVGLASLEDDSWPLRHLAAHVLRRVF